MGVGRGGDRPPGSGGSNPEIRVNKTWPGMRDDLRSRQADTRPTTGSEHSTDGAKPEAIGLGIWKGMRDDLRSRQADTRPTTGSEHSTDGARLPSVDQQRGPTASESEMPQAETRSDRIGADNPDSRFEEVSKKIVALSDDILGRPGDIMGPGEWFFPVHFRDSMYGVRETLDLGSRPAFEPWIERTKDQIAEIKVAKEDYPRNPQMFQRELDKLEKYLGLMQEANSIPDPRTDGDQPK